MDQVKKEKLRDFFNQFFDDADNDDIRFQKAKEKLKEMRKTSPFSQTCPSTVKIR